MSGSGPKPLHPGTVLRERVLPGLGLSVSQASRDLGVCRQTLHRILAGTAAVTPDMAVRLARLSSLPGHFWLDLQQVHDLARAETDLAEVLPTIPAHVLPAATVNELTAYGR
ncbi:HigA family addiction module antitoxin (plasmid) [Methylobacterium oryzae CBMB20]